MEQSIRPRRLAVEKTYPPRTGTVPDWACIETLDCPAADSPAQRRIGDCALRLSLVAALVKQLPLLNAPRSSQLPSGN